MRKGLLLGLAAAWLVAGAAHAELISHSAFRDAVIAAIRKQAPHTPIRVTDEDGFVAGTGDKQINAYTGNLYRQYAEDPAQLQATIAKAVRVLTLAGQTKVYRIADLRVAVRPRDYLIGGTRDGVLKALTRPVAGDLVAVVGVDSAEAVEYPPAEDLEKQLNLSADAVWTRAWANSRRTLPKRLDALKPAALNVITLDDGYAASVLADDDLWRDADKRYPEGLIVAAPERNTVLILRRHAANDVDVMRTLLKASVGSPQELSPLVLTRKAGAWVVVR